MKAILCFVLGVLMTSGALAQTSLVGEWKGEVFCSYQQTWKMEWSIKDQTSNGTLHGSGRIPSYGKVFTLDGSKVDGTMINMPGGYEDLTVSGNIIKGRWQKCEVMMSRRP